MKISIIYYSLTGNTKEMAEIIAKGTMHIDGIETRCFDVDHIDQEFLSESNAVIIGTPSYYANMCWQIKNGLILPETSLEKLEPLSVQQNGLPGALM